MLTKRQSSWAAKAAVIAAATALALTACSGQPAASGTRGSAKGSVEKVTLHFMWWGSNIRNTETQKAIDAFEKKNANITVKGEFVDWAGYWDKLATMTAGGGAPDVIQMSDAYMAEYAGRGALLDLSKQKELDTSALDKSSLKSGEIKGALDGVEAGANAPVILANSKLFSDAGVKMPDDKTWTWDDYTRIAKSLTKGLPAGDFGASSLKGDPDMNAWLRQRGKSRFANDGKVGFNAHDSAEYLSFIKMQSDQKATPPAAVITERLEAPVEQSGLATNTVAMSSIWSNELPAYEASCGCQLTILRLPSLTGKVSDNGMYLRGSQYYSASSQTKHPAEAAKLINFLVNDPKAGDIIQTERGIPINAHIRDRIKGKVAPADGKVLEFISKIAPELKAAPGPVPVGGGQYDAITHRYVSDVLFGKTTPQEAGKQAVAELKAALADAE